MSHDVKLDGCILCFYLHMSEEPSRGKMGECRRREPTRDNDGKPCYPLVDSEHWCGEHLLIPHRKYCERVARYDEGKPECDQITSAELEAAKEAKAL